MDKTNMEIMTSFERKYIRHKNQKVLDLGSRDVNGNFRNIFKRHRYVGADIVPGKNVDIILREPYKWQFEDNRFDVIVSASTIEHMTQPWTWFQELYRILKPGGITCIIAPASLHQHRHPIDCYRYYPDGMYALCQWAGLTQKRIRKVKVPNSYAEYTYLIAKKV
jgi:SAM-dependent methyltransferase